MSTPPPPPSSDSNASGEGLAALERLRKRVEDAALEIERLRSENAALTERVQDLASEEVARGEALSPLAIEGDPDTLRKQIEEFIEAIDRILAVPDTPEPAARVEPTDEKTTSESSG